jgi:hypothetical protein
MRDTNYKRKYDLYIMRKMLREIDVEKLGTERTHC